MPALRQLCDVALSKMTEPRVRGWCFTVQAGHLAGLDKGPAVTEDEAIHLLKQAGAQYLVVQKETGEEGTDHLQGFIYFKNPIGRAGALKKMGINAHMEIMRGKISEAADYCMKADTQREAYIEQGVRPMDNGERSSLLEACDTARTRGIKRCAKEHPAAFVRYHAGLTKYANIEEEGRLPTERDVIVIWVWGQSGCGKSYYAEHYDSPENTFAIGDADKLGNKLWFDGYDGQRTLVIEEFDGLAPYRVFLRVLDRYRVNCEVKSGFVWGQWTTVIVTSNDPPWHMWGSSTDCWSTHAGVPESPLQRRIHWISQGTGVYPNNTWDLNPPQRVIVPATPEVNDGKQEADPLTLPTQGLSDLSLDGLLDDVLGTDGDATLDEGDIDLINELNGFF